MLDLIGVAGEEYEEAGRAEGMWSVLFPPPSMQGVVEEVYRSHCRELIERHRRGESLEPGTRAEMLLALSEASLRAPFNSTGLSAYALLARRVLVNKEGKCIVEEDVRGLPREPYEGAVNELLAGLQQRLAVRGRGVTPAPRRAPKGSLPREHRARASPSAEAPSRKPRKTKSRRARHAA